METLGFIILRHVNNDSTNRYWIHCYECIRKYYPENFILIIYDNSEYKYITNEKMYKTYIINSEYPKRGELLPYYYYLQNKLFDNAVILHDSVFINSYIDFTIDKYKMIWEFNKHCWDQIEDETKMINLFNDKELLEFYENKSLWSGCFGGMVIISFEFLQFINSKYDITKLLDYVLTRHNRCSFERVIACLLQKEHNKSILIGDINDCGYWGITFDDIDDCKDLQIIKVWSGR
jgi:hypothetical protein